MMLLLTSLLVLVNCYYSSGQASQPPTWLFNQLKLSGDSIPLDLIAEKQHPVYSEYTIYGIPYITEYDCGKDCWSADMYVVVADASHKILRMKRMKGALTADAIYPKKVWIDTAPYILAANKRAFAIRVESANNSRAARYVGEELWLMLETISEIDCRLHLDSKTLMSYGGGGCEGEVHNQESIFIIDTESKTSEYYNIVEQLKYEHFFVNEDCEDRKKEVKRFKNVYRYSDGEYKVVGERKKGW